MVSVDSNKIHRSRIYVVKGPLPSGRKYSKPIAHTWWSKYATYAFLFYFSLSLFLSFLSPCVSLGRRIVSSYHDNILCSLLGIKPMEIRQKKISIHWNSEPVLPYSRILYLPSRSMANNELEKDDNEETETENTVCVNDFICFHWFICALKATLRPWTPICNIHQVFMRIRNRASTRRLYAMNCWSADSSTPCIKCTHSDVAGVTNSEMTVFFFVFCLLSMLIAKKWLLFYQFELQRDAANGKWCVQTFHISTTCTTHAHAQTKVSRQNVSFSCAFNGCSLDINDFVKCFRKPCQSIRPTIFVLNRQNQIRTENPNWIAFNVVFMKISPITDRDFIAQFVMKIRNFRIENSK